MNPQLRIARPVGDLERSVRMYVAGLGLAEVSRFRNHDGFDGVMLAFPLAEYHLEFTVCRTHQIVPHPSVEDLIVFFVPDDDEWMKRCAAMISAGFLEVPPFNAYWAARGRTFEDHDGYRTVLQHSAWKPS